tara:strand:+ start:402 stop:743 length:342 start_codon:yes stop_codon:yes gene_type:complete
MEEETLQVQLTESALADLHEIDDYWFRRGEPETGERYVGNLMDMAESELSSYWRAKRGRQVRVSVLPDTREILVFKGSYRIIYRIDAVARIVQVLRFWHSHRDEPELNEDRED